MKVTKQTTNAKQYDDKAWVYNALLCRTGSEQPSTPDTARIEACCDFTDDYTVMFDMRGALDAPERIPSGSVRAQDFDSGPGRILVGHVYRAGWHS